MDLKYVVKFGAGQLFLLQRVGYFVFQFSNNNLGYSWLGIIIFHCLLTLLILLVRQKRKIHICGLL
jgi:hypothetical protein